MRRSSLIAAGMLLVCCSVAFALNPALAVSQYARTSWKVRDGVFKGSIYAIAQTLDGYLWLGTEFGLVRFDGVRAVAWQPSGDQALGAGPIHALLTARDGTLWIGADSGLASWKAGKLTQYPELAGYQVSALLEDRERTVWAGSFGIPTGRLCAIRAGRATCEDAAVGGGPAGFYEDRKGNLWAGVPNGLWRWKPGDPEFYSLPDEPSGVRVLGEDEDGSLLIVRGRRIARFVDGRLEPSSLQDGVPDDFARRLLRDRDGGLWVATVNRGLAHVHGGRTDRFAEGDGLSGDSVRDLFEDREGNIWVATLSGLDRFRDFSIPTWTQKEGLTTPLVWSVLGARDGSIWLGSALGLGRWHNAQITRFGRDGGLLNGLGPHSLFEDHRGRIWVATNRDFGYLQNDRFIPIGAVPGGYVLSIVEDTARDIWIVNRQRGLIRVRDEAVEQIPWAALGHTDHAMVAIADPRRGGIWLGFDKGGVAHFSGDRLGVAYSAEDGLGDGQILDFRFSADGALWAATQGGLSRLKGGNIETLSSKNGLPCDTVHWSMEDDDQALWLYTACGLLRIARSAVDTWAAAAEKGEHSTVAVQLTVFDSSDGVRSNQVFPPQKPRVTKTAGGTLVFLPIDGVSIVDPRRLLRNELPPPVYVEQITADRATYDAAQGLRLPPRVRDLQIDYTALSLVAPEKNRFRTKLEGRDATGRTSARGGRRSIPISVPARTASGSPRATTAACGTKRAPRWSSRSRLRTTRRDGSRPRLRVACSRCSGWRMGCESVKLRGSSTAPWTRASASGRASRGNCTTRCCKASTVCCCDSRPPCTCCQSARQKRKRNSLVRLIRRRRRSRKGAMPCRDYGPPPSKRTTSLWRSARWEQNSRPTAAASDRHSTWPSKARRESSIRFFVTRSTRLLRKHFGMPSGTRTPDGSRSRSATTPSNSACACVTMVRGSIRRCSQPRGVRDTTDCAACQNVRH